MIDPGLRHIVRCGRDVRRDIREPAEPPASAVDRAGNTFANGDLLIFCDGNVLIECKCSRDRMRRRGLEL